MRSIAGAGAGAALGLVVISGLAQAADPEQKPAAPKAEIRLAPSQTASLGQVARPSYGQPVLKLDLVPMRIDDVAPADRDADLVPKDPVAEPPPTVGVQTGARFVPMLRKTDNADDPNNHGRFVDKHEFGIELKSDF